MKDILLDFKKYIVGSKESTKIESASNIDFKKEVAKFAYFDSESFDIYQETLYNNVEDNLFYIGVASSSNLLGENKFHIANKPSDIFQVIEKASGGDFKAGIKRSGRGFVEYFIAASNGRYDSIQIVGIADPEMFDRLTEALTEEHIKRVLIESDEDLDMSYLYKNYGSQTKMRVPLNLYDLVLGVLIGDEIEVDDFGKDLFFGTLADLRLTLEKLGLNYVSTMQPAGGFVIEFDDYNKYRRLISKIIGKYTNEHQLKLSVVSEAIKLGINK